MMKFFVTATDTDVGKSYVCSGLARAFVDLKINTAYFKPFQSGVVKGCPSDAQIVQKNCLDVFVKNSYITKYPCTPLISAELEGVDIDIEKVKNDYDYLDKNFDAVVVEGSGGLFVPVKKNFLMSDVIKRLNLPVLIVARPDLGTINHTLMTIKCCKDLSISVAGVVISNYPKDTNDPVITRAQEMIESFCSASVIDVINQDQKDFSRLANYLLKI